MILASTWVLFGVFTVGPGPLPEARQETGVEGTRGGSQQTGDETKKPGAKKAGTKKPGSGPRPTGKTDKGGDAGGQDKAGDPDPKVDGEDPDRKIVVPRIRPARSAIPNYRVLIRTKGGRKFTGIVCKDPRFHERVYAGDHHKPEIYASREGFTLRFVDGLDGEVHLDWIQLTKLEVKEILDNSRVRSLEDSQRRTRVVRVSEAARRADLEDARKKELEGETTDPEGEDGSDPDRSGGDEPESGAKTDDGRAAILVEFPPEDGWALARKENLEWRRTVLGVFPDEKEQSFLDRFPEWQEAHAKWEREQEKKKEGGEDSPNAERKDPAGDQERPRGTARPGSDEKGEAGEESREERTEDSRREPPKSDGSRGRPSAA